MRPCVDCLNGVTNRCVRHEKMTVASSSGFLARILDLALEGAPEYRHNINPRTHSFLTCVY